MAVSSEEETLVEEREELMVSPFGGKPSLKVAHFLKPSFPYPQHTQNSQTLFKFKPSKPIAPKLTSFTSIINFYGWKCPLKNWNSWVKKMQPSFESTWKKASIFEPIMASTLEIPRYHDSIFALAERWSPKTNTFVFPWGEATITLEDVMVLGGFSVTGHSGLTQLYTKQQHNIESELFKARSKLLRSKAKKATQHQWMAHWMENGSEFEHEAFLSLWMSRFVLPSDSDSTMNKSVFPIAILLANGTKIALAPAVLASIYRDLSLLKEKIETLGDKDVENVKRFSLWAPLQLLQAWFWERFPSLRPEPSPITNVLPRLAMWHKVKLSKKGDLGSAIDSCKENFLWRPYCTTLNNCSVIVKLYSEENGWVSVDSDAHLDLQSYARCIRVSELVGLDCNCIEQYLPHRVSMQFGFDQDIPMDIPRLNGNQEIAWNNYIRPISDVKLYVPSRLTKSDVTTRYLELWEKSNFVAESMRIKLENNEADVPPGFSPKRNGVAMAVSSDQPSSKRSKTSSDGYSGIRMKSNDTVATSSSPHINRMEAEDDSDSDHLTLKKLFQLGSTSKDDRNGNFSLSRAQSPLSSAGDNVLIRETSSPRQHTGCVGPSEGTRRGSNTEDGIENEVGSQIKSPMTTNKKEVGTSSSTAPECAEKVDLAERIARLQRIVNMVKAAKTSHL